MLCCILGNILQSYAMLICVDCQYDRTTSVISLHLIAFSSMGFVMYPVAMVSLCFIHSLQLTRKLRTWKIVYWMFIAVGWCSVLDVYSCRLSQCTQDLLYFKLVIEADLSYLCGLSCLPKRDIYFLRSYSLILSFYRDKEKYVRLVQWLRLLTFISADGVQLPVKSAVFSQSP